MRDYYLANGSTNMPHSSQTGKGLFLLENGKGELEPQWRPLVEFEDVTCELIGPKVNSVRVVLCKSYWMIEH